MSGKARRLPEGFALWFFHTLADSGYNTGYYPRYPVDSLMNDQWAVADSAARVRKKKHYAIVMVGKDAEALINTYKGAMNGMEREGRRLGVPDDSVFQWPPLIDSTSDMVECERFSVEWKTEDGS